MKKSTAAASKKSAKSIRTVKLPPIPSRSSAVAERPAKKPAAKSPAKPVKVNPKSVRYAVAIGFCVLLDGVTSTNAALAKAMSDVKLALSKAGVKAENFDNDGAWIDD